MTCPVCNGAGILPGPIDPLSGKPDELDCHACNTTGEAAAA